MADFFTDLFAIYSKKTFYCSYNLAYHTDNDIMQIIYDWNFLGINYSA